MGLDKNQAVVEVGSSWRGGFREAILYILIIIMFFLFDSNSKRGQYEEQKLKMKNNILSLF